jgi:hypothetical protein
LLIAIRNTPAKSGIRRTSPGIPTVLRQIGVATAQHEMSKNKPPASLVDLVGMDIPTSDGQLTQFSVALIEQEIGTNISAIKYFPEFGVVDFGQVPPEKIVLSYIPELGNTEYCQVLYYDGKRTTERTSLLKVNQKIEWLNSYKNSLKSNLPPPSAPMPD